MEEKQPKKETSSSNKKQTMSYVTYDREGLLNEKVSLSSNKELLKHCATRQYLFQ